LLYFLLKVINSIKKVPQKGAKEEKQGNRRRAVGGLCNVYRTTTPAASQGQTMAIYRPTDRLSRRATTGRQPAPCLTVLHGSVLFRIYTFFGELFEGLLGTPYVGLAWVISLKSH